MLVLLLTLFFVLSSGNTNTIVNGTETNLSISCEVNDDCNAQTSKELDTVANSVNTVANEISNMDKSNFTLTIISIVVASGATIIAGLSFSYSSKYSRKQLEQSEKDMKLRLRPWVILDGPRPRQVVLGPGVMDYETFSKLPMDQRGSAQSVRMAIPYRNGGQLIANNVKLVFILQKEPFDRSIFEQKQEKDVLPLAPSQEHFRAFSIPYEDFLNLSDIPLYVGVSISYDTEFGRAYSGIIYKIKKGADEGIDAWFT